MQLSIARTLLAILTAVSHDGQLNSLVSAKESESPTCESSYPFSFDSGMAHKATTKVSYSGAPWIQLDLRKTNLSANAKLVLTSSRGVVQELDETALVLSNGYSATFDGDSVTVELTHTPGGLFRGSSPQGQASQVIVSSVKIGLCKPQDETICGTGDDRILSEDVRQGRMGGCTAFLVSKNVFVWAGHCVGDLSTPTSSDRIQFVYDSSSALSVDQYAVDIPTYRGSKGAAGYDWGAGRFTQTNGRWPGDAQALKCQNQVCDHCTGNNAGKECGWYNLGTAPGSTSGNSIRVTGYGTANTQDRWQKTHTGSLTGITSISLGYETDTTAGNSGSPLEDELTGDAIGIHTDGGCGATGGRNQGTRIDQVELAAHIDFLTTVCTSDAECSSLVGGATCDDNSQCQFEPAPTQAPTPSPVCSGGTITVEIFTDQYPEETSWTLTNTDTNTIVASRAQGWYTDQYTVYAPVKTCDDNNDAFSFTINDQYGDGICCGGDGDGYYKIMYDGVEVATGGDFASSDTKTFSGGDAASSSPSKSPTSSPTAPTESPTRGPTPPPVPATPIPSKAPSSSPTTGPTGSPVLPTKPPSKAPSSSPTTGPTGSPVLPTNPPSKAPSTSPTLRPTPAPTAFACSDFSKNNCPAGLCKASGNQCNDCDKAGTSCSGNCNSCCSGAYTKAGNSKTCD